MNPSPDFWKQAVGTCSVVLPIFAAIILQNKSSNYRMTVNRKRMFLTHRVYMDAVVGFVCERCGVTGGVSVFVPGLNLQSVLLPVC